MYLAGLVSYIVSTTKKRSNTGEGGVIVGCGVGGVLNKVAANFADLFARFEIGYMLGTSLAER